MRKQTKSEWTRLSGAGRLRRKPVDWRVLTSVPSKQ